MVEIHYFKKLPSTNDKVKEFKENSVVVADIQTKARGRFRRKWSSGEGGLWLSILLRPKHIEKLGYLTFCAAIACQKAVKKLGVESKVKWPNDLVIGKKKLCGILTEGSFGDRKLVVVGIGMNTNNKIPKNLSKKAISIATVKNGKVDNKQIVKNLLKEFYLLYKKFNDKKYSSILTEWKRLSNTIGKDVKVVTRKKTIIGRVIDVDNDLRLIVKSFGRIYKIIEGDVSEQ